jgi:hypothetical protein
MNMSLPGGTGSAQYLSTRRKVTPPPKSLHGYRLQQVCNYTALRMKTTGAPPPLGSAMKAVKPSTTTVPRGPTPKPPAL